MSDNADPSEGKEIFFTKSLPDVLTNLSPPTQIREASFEDEVNKWANPMGLKYDPIGTDLQPSGSDTNSRQAKAQRIAEYKQLLDLLPEYKVTANNVEGQSVATISDVTGFNDGDYVTLTFPKPKKRLTQRLKQIVNQLRHRKNAKESE